VQLLAAARAPAADIDCNSVNSVPAV